MLFIIYGFIAVYGAWRVKMSDGVIIAIAILMSAFAITDKLWDIRIRLTEIKDKIKMQ